jgi:two-component system, OmpR family, response regulator
MSFSDTAPLCVRRWTDRRIGTAGQPLQVLVVDDDENAAAALAACLTLEEMECRLALGGAEAIAIGTRWLPHVILMDISMPECNGVQAARALRLDPLASGITIIAHTALDETEVRRHLAGAELDGYFQKGQPVDRLVALIASFEEISSPPERRS